MFGAVQIPQALGPRPVRASGLAATAATALAAVAMLFGSTGPAAASGPAAHTTSASLQAALPGCSMNDHARPGVRRDGSTIVGTGGFFGCSGSPYAQMTLQRSRWYGWENLKTWIGNFTPGRTYSVSYNCRGTGTYTYRTIMTGRDVAGRPTFKESRRLRTPC
jgi:hypothetical protein